MPLDGALVAAGAEGNSELPEPAVAVCADDVAALDEPRLPKSPPELGAAVAVGACEVAALDDPRLPNRPPPELGAEVAGAALGKRLLEPEADVVAGLENRLLVPEGAGVDPEWPELEALSPAKSGVDPDAVLEAG